MHLIKVTQHCFSQWVDAFQIAIFSIHPLTFQTNIIAGIVKNVHFCVDIMLWVNFLYHSIAISIVHCYNKYANTWCTKNVQIAYIRCSVLPGARRRGSPRTAWMDNIKMWTGLSVEKSVRMTEERDKWRKSSMLWPTLGSRTAKEQNNGYRLFVHFWYITYYRICHRRAVIL